MKNTMEKTLCLLDSGQIKSLKKCKLVAVKCPALTFTDEEQN